MSGLFRKADASVMVEIAPDYRASVKKNSYYSESRERLLLKLRIDRLARFRIEPWNNERREGAAGSAELAPEARRENAAYRS
jgi:hypothetical protein